MRVQVRRAIFAQSRGQAVILMAIVMVVLVGFLGLAIDGSLAYANRRRALNASDTAAMFATRDLIRVQRDGLPMSTITDTINATLARQPITIAGVTWTAEYIRRDDTNSGCADFDTVYPFPPTGSNVDLACGIRVNLTYTFNTYFMPLFGYDTLTVGSTSTAIYGPLGNAIGPDLVPLAFPQDRETAVRNNATATFYLDIENKEYNYRVANAQDTSKVIRSTALKHVSLSNVAGAPVTGSIGADCTSASPQNSLVGWWCNGTNFAVRTNREMYESAPDFAELSQAIAARSTRPVGGQRVMVMPIWAIEPMSGVTTIDGFIAFELLGVNSRGALQVRFMKSYATSGGILSESSNLDRGTYAINLVR